MTFAVVIESSAGKNIDDAFRWAFRPGLVPP